MGSLDSTDDGVELGLLLGLSVEGDDDGLEDGRSEGPLESMLVGFTEFSFEGDNVGNRLGNSDEVVVGFIL